MEELEVQKNNLEIVLPSNSLDKEKILLNKEQAELAIQKISNEIGLQKKSILDITQKVNEIRKNLGLSGDVEIPSTEFNKKNILNLENKRKNLEDKLSEILQSDLSEKYTDIIKKIKQSKIDWANSEELTRRLKLKGADDNDIAKIKEWLISNINNVKTFVLPQNKFEEVIQIINEMTQDDSIKQGAAFYVPGGRDDMHEDFKNAVFIKEKTNPSVPLPNGEVVTPKEYISETQLSHEIGHAAQDGLLEADEFSNSWNPKFKENAPDKEYVGRIQETDTRIRSMFSILGDSFNPEKEVFGRKQLEILREKQKNGLLDKDIKDLLDHYDDIELVKMANRMPAI